MRLLKTLAHKNLMLFCLAAVVPLVLMAVMFHIPLSSNGQFFPGTNQKLLGYVIHSSFLAAACGVVPLVPLLVTSKGAAGRWIARAAFAVLGFACAWIAYVLAGTYGMVLYVVMVFVTYGGCTLFIFDWLFGVTRTFLTLLRWSVALFSYVTLQLQFNLDVDISTWRNSEEALLFGASYFYLLALLEIVLYPVLTWYLEHRLRGEERYSVALDGFGHRQVWD